MKKKGVGKIKKKRMKKKRLKLLTTFPRTLCDEPLRGIGRSPLLLFLVVVVVEEPEIVTFFPPLVVFVKLSFLTSMLQLFSSSLSGTKTQNIKIQKQTKTVNY